MENLTSDNKTLPRRPRTRSASPAPAPAESSTAAPAIAAAAALDPEPGRMPKEPAPKRKRNGEPLQVRPPMTSAEYRRLQAELNRLREIEYQYLSICRGFDLW